MAYLFTKIEKKWQAAWKKSDTYNPKNSVKGKKNFYNLVMFPYPSGNLHIGHWYNFVPADVYARFMRAQGRNVMCPIGFDAFGLPAENAAIKNGIHPSVWTMKNIKKMTGQLQSMGNSFDWSHSVVTCLPEYYKWNQWIFLQLYKKGLAYRVEAPANWCISCKTVLANEQVVEGKCERCGNQVEQREIKQWKFKITKYAKALLKDLDGLDWPEKTKTMQRNWIGESEGAQLTFALGGNDAANQKSLTVFTTRPDTVLGVTYVVIAPEHPLLKDDAFLRAIENHDEVRAYIEKTKEKSDLDRTDLIKEKTGVALRGVFAINPATGEKVPVWTGDYVLGTYGTGAVMAVPAHDERDKEFAATYQLPVSDAPLLTKEEGIAKANGKKLTMYRLRDWLISRQRYWGTPIPIVYCEKCGEQPVKEKDLPVKLPKLDDYKPAEDGRSPLARKQSFVNAKCPKCGGKATRETDTMDTFVDSSWYFLRYTDPKNAKQAFGAKAAQQWFPVNMYVGGAEHTVLHLLYARFFTKFFKDLGLISAKEPFLKLRHQGMILGPDGQKMSKSKGNVIDPDALVAEFGADAVRTYLCFMGQYDQGGPWNPTGILGITRFLDRIERYFGEINAKENIEISDSLERLIHCTIKKVGEDISEMKFNTAVSAMMICFNEMESVRLRPSATLGASSGQESNMLPLQYQKAFLQMLAPFAPHLAEEMWQKRFAKKGKFVSVHAELFPKYKKDLAAQKNIEFVVQVNGKVRAKLSLEKGLGEEAVKKIVLADEQVAKHLAGATIRKIIFVQDRLMSIVVG